MTDTVKKIKFGTDGWRAIIAEDFTFENVRRCAQGVALYLIDTGTAQNGLVIGYDTRFASENFAATAAEVLAGNGIKVYLCNKAAPTPVISFDILTRKAAGAIIVTSSHNPALWSGIKYKPEYAGSASPEVIGEIEKRIPDSPLSVKNITLKEGLNTGIIEYVDPFPRYNMQIARLVDLEAIKKAKLTVVIDSMYGVGAGIIKSYILGGNIRVTEINNVRNPLFPGIQPEPILHNLLKLSKKVKSSHADVGLATDGDADRLGLMDENGQFITQLVAFALLSLYMLEVRKERGPLIKTVTTTSMIYRLGELYNVPVYETAVGFKYVGPYMIKENALIGGEESGGYGFRGHIPERDGILAALYFLDLMIKLKKTPSQLVSYLYEKVGPHYYDRIDIIFPEEQRKAVTDRVTGSQPKKITNLKVKSMDRVDGFRYHLTDGSWLLIRFSGTEPLLRIYAEAPGMDQVRKMLEEGRKIAGV
ncbi:MAG: phosphoglucomutase/phosphomannomutase family protein [Chloroflexi bacterium]|nr:phosphoglucomutase/phosphomannomutase family protein [Chloroflexota bacterium]